MKKIKKGKFLIAFVFAILMCTANIFAAPEKDKEGATLDADTVEYDMKTGQAKAEGNVLMTRGLTKLTGKYAEYNLNTKVGTVEGNVIGVREKMRITCDKLRSEGPEHMFATGNVKGREEDKTFEGDYVEYFPEQNDYVKIPGKGKITSKDGVFTANMMEGWLKDEHYVGVGNAHLISPPNDLEGGGDRVDYFGKEEGKAILTGNAWAFQDNHMVRGNKITIYLAKDGKAKIR
ncbi:MAG: organic solvent tolerance protein OstA [Selenomonadaceae bacterium]|nr:organic solvent tolerance protein OstA [Selenomonadaceae bacterium]